MRVRVRAYVRGELDGVYVRACVFGCVFERWHGVEGVVREGGGGGGGERGRGGRTDERKVSEAAKEERGSEGLGGAPQSPGLRTGACVRACARACKHTRRALRAGAAVPS